MSVIVFAGAAQFAAVGYVANGLPWPGVILLTALLNARHLLYSAALAPWLRPIPVWRRAIEAHLLTDESFALGISHFRRIGRTDERGYWLGAFVCTFIPWNLASLGGVVIGAQIPDPARFGIDVIFPAR
jgi:predicted branched-subunit amino acid permease